MGRKRPTKKLSLSAEVKEFLDEQSNASQLVDRLVSEYIREQAQQEYDPEVAESLAALDRLEGEVTADRAAVRYAAKPTNLTAEELVEIWREDE